MRPLTARDIETLEALRFASAHARKYDKRTMHKEGWVQSLECGGSNGSHHSHTLSKLAKRGYAERHKFGTRREKGSCLYRISDTGRRLLRAKPKGGEMSG